MSIDISIIIPALNEGISAQIMVYNINQTIGLDDYEIIIVNSGGTDTSGMEKLLNVCVYNMPRQGAPQARNFGARQTSCRHLIFADCHLEFTKGWGPKILNALERNPKSIITPCITAIGDHNSRGCGFKWKNLNMEPEWLPDINPQIHEIPFACGCCMAIEKRHFDELGQFDSGIRLWGGEDSDICLRSWLFGYGVLCDPSIRVAHKFKTSFLYPVEWLDINYNKIRFSFSHFSSERLTRVLRSMYDENDFSKALIMVLENGVLDRRNTLFTKRIYNDDWFFRKYPMNNWQ